MLDVAAILGVLRETSGFPRENHFEVSEVLYRLIEGKSMSLLSTLRRSFEIDSDIRDLKLRPPVGFLGAVVTCWYIDAIHSITA